MLRTGDDASEVSWVVMNGVRGERDEAEYVDALGREGKHVGGWLESRTIHLLTKPQHLINEYRSCASASAARLPGSRAD